MIDVRIQSEPIEAPRLLAAAEAAGAGAVASFTGIVRADDGVTALTLEHYPGMTEAVLSGLAQSAMVRWKLAGVTIVHRTGRMVPGDRVVFVACASTHRGDALSACAMLIDRLKTDAPFWKREEADGVARWVEPRASDHQAAARWHPQLP